MQTASLLQPDLRVVAPERGLVSTPERFRSGYDCQLQLTPVWKYVVKKKRFPKNVDREEVFSQLAVRLQHPEWQVSGQTSR